MSAMGRDITDYHNMINGFDGVSVMEFDGNGKIIRD